MNEEQEGIELETIDPNGVSYEMDNGNVQEDNTQKEKSLLKGVNEERRKRKEAEKKARELEARVLALEEASKVPEKNTVDELVEQGVDESIAKSIAQAIDKRSDTSTKQELANLKFKISLTEKSKEEGFEDILDYADEIEDLVNKGLSLEQSYYATTYNNGKTTNTKSEIERKLEAKMQNNQARKEILGNSFSSNNSASASSKRNVVATATEKAIAAAAGMSVEEYVAIRDIDSIKDYNSYRAKKK